MTEGDIMVVLMEIAREEVRRDNIRHRINALDTERERLVNELRGTKDALGQEDPRWAALREKVRPIIEELKLIV